MSHPSTPTFCLPQSKSQKSEEKCIGDQMIIFVVIQSLSRVWLFVTP